MCSCVLTSTGVRRWSELPERVRISTNEMIRNGGLFNFRRAVRFAARYGQACDLAGRLLTIEEYGEFVGLSRSQAFREQASWRACCGKVSVLEVVSAEALRSRGFSEAEREEAIARELAGGAK